MDFNKNLHHILVDAYADARVGEKNLAYGKLNSASEYAKIHKIPFSEEDHRKKLNLTYQRVGLEKKINVYLTQAYISAAEGIALYKEHLAQAFEQVSECDAPSKRIAIEGRVRGSSKVITRTYHTVGIPKLKKKKSEEIINYAKRGDFESMVMAIKHNDFQFHFNEAEKSEFYEAYRTQGEPRRIDFLLYSAELAAAKMNYQCMTKNLEEATSLSEKAGLLERIFTWFIGKQIKRAYHQKMKDATHLIKNDK